MIWRWVAVWLRRLARTTRTNGRSGSETPQLVGPVVGPRPGRRTSTVLKTPLASELGESGSEVGGGREAGYGVLRISPAMAKETHESLELRRVPSYQTVLDPPCGMKPAAAAKHSSSLSQMPSSAPRPSPRASYDALLYS